MNIHNLFEDKATKHFPADVKCFSHKQPAKSSWECSKQGEDCTCNNVAGIPGIDGPIGGRGGNAGRPGTITVLKVELLESAVNSFFEWLCIKYGGAVI